MAVPSRVPEPTDRGRWLLVALLLAVGAAQLLAFHDWRHDDAFISYRYAQNLAEGRGLVFNPGERVMGSTAPGHVLLASVLYRLVGHDALPTAMAAVGCLAWLAQSVALYLLLLPALGRRAAGVVGLGVALGIAGSARWVALETNLVAALVLFALVAAGADRFDAAALLAGLAVLVRPDALIAAGLLAALCVARLRWRAWRPALLFLAPLLPWLLFAWSWFGTPLPRSAAAKFQRESVADYALHLLRFPIEQILPFALGPGLLGVAAALTWLAVGGGALSVVRRQPPLGLLVAWPLLHAAAYLWLRPFRAHVWHLYPVVLVAATLLLALLAVGVFASRRSRDPETAGPAARLGQAASALVLLVLLTGWARLFALEPYSLEDAYWVDRHQGYVQVAEFLGERSTPGTRVAAVEVGTLAYHSGLPMLDLGGLVLPSDPDPEQLSFDWIVLDRLYASALAGHPAWRLEQGAFEVWVARNEDGRLDPLVRPPGEREPPPR